MDKLKPYLENLKKYHFWLLCAVILGASFFAWRSGTKTLAELFETNSSTIAGAFSQAEGVGAHNPHPNGSFIKEKKDAHDRLLAELKAAWQMHYDRQQAVLVWPGAPLLPDFAAKVGALGPDEDIPDLLKQNYKANAKNIPATWIPKYNLRRAVAGMGRDQVLEGVLVWNDIPRLEHRYTFNADPTTKQIRIAQEDFWMYEVVLAAVARLNEGRTQHHEAIVKQILALNIAQNALMVPPPTLANLPAAVDGGGDLSKEIKPPAADAPDDLLVAYRYCNPNNGKPLPAPTGKEEFLLMPVHLVVIMDQRRVPDLLLSCANSPLLFDTTLLLFNDADTMVVDAAAGRGGGGGAAAPAGPAAGRGGAGGAAAQAALTAELGPYDARVEIRGYMYLFNPPDPALFTPRGAPEGPDVAAAE